MQHTIVRVSIPAGYSSKDHLIDGDEAKSVIGKSYRTHALAVKDAENVADANANRGVDIARVDVTTKDTYGHFHGSEACEAKEDATYTCGYCQRRISPSTRVGCDSSSGTHER